MNAPTPTPPGLSCEQCRDLLSGYVDRELEPRERAAVEHHVATCMKCGTESSRLHGLKNVVRHWEGVKGSGEFRRSVLEKMISESQLTASKPFTEAAAQARAESARGASPERKGLPAAWILGAAVVLALAAYSVLRLLLNR